MTSLIERLESAAEGSRELSALVLNATIAPKGSWVEKSPFNGAWVIYSSRRPDGAPRIWEAHGDDHQIKIASVTESLDAALSLAARVVGEKEAMLSLDDVLGDPNDDLTLISHLAPRLCAAILRAKEQAS